MNTSDLLPPQNRLYCSFCGKESTEVEKLIAGPASHNICNECVDQCVHMVRGGDQMTPFNLGMYSLIKEVERLRARANMRRHPDCTGRYDCQCLMNPPQPDTQSDMVAVPREVVERVFSILHPLGGTDPEASESVNRALSMLQPYTKGE